MATSTTTKPKTVTASQTLEIILKQLTPEERAVVQWNISSPNLVKRLVDDAVIIDGRDGELLVSDVAPNYVLVFRETADQYDLLDLMGKRSLNWKEFPPPDDDHPKPANGRPAPRRKTAPKPANGKAAK